MFFAFNFLSDTQDTVFVLSLCEEAEGGLRPLLTGNAGAFGGDTLNLDRFAVLPEGIGSGAG